MSWIDGANSVTYALGQFCCGTLGDRWGARRIVLIGMLASVVASLLMGASYTVPLLGLLYGIQGFSQASGWAPLAKNVRPLFSHRHRGRILRFRCLHYAA